MGGQNGSDIRERTFRFAVRIIKVVHAIPRNLAGAVLARQLARSGTSIGANVEEAEAAHSRAEFIRRMNISRAEARETHYWLRVLGESGLMPASKLSRITPEANEIVSILTAIVQNARRRTA